MACYIKLPPETPYVWCDCRRGIHKDWLVGFDGLDEISAGQVIEVRDPFVKMRGKATVAEVNYTNGYLIADVRWGDDDRG